MSQKFWLEKVKVRGFSTDFIFVKVCALKKEGVVHASRFNYFLLLSFRITFKHTEIVKFLVWTASETIKSRRTIFKLSFFYWKRCSELFFTQVGDKQWETVGGFTSWNWIIDAISNKLKRLRINYLQLFLQRTLLPRTLQLSQVVGSYSEPNSLLQMVLPEGNAVQHPLQRSSASP